MTTSETPKSSGSNVYIKETYSAAELKSDMAKLHHNFDIENLGNGYSDGVVKKLSTQFNRFKMAFPDEELTKTFAYVFFTRPDLNILTSSTKLSSQADADPLYNYLYKNNPSLFRNLTKYGSGIHAFNVFLSNKAKSFEISDEYIKTVEAGETFTGYKIHYGRNDIESKAAGEFTISYRDNYNLDVFRMHKLWVDYISKVFRGEFSPRNEHKQNKELDYACSVYYFLLGPDQQTILFWSKYIGVFPTNTSSSTYSWDSQSILKVPEPSLKYAYSIKRDFDPTHLAEFNTLSSNYSTAKPMRVYEEKHLGVGSTWVGAPFVVTSKNAKGETVYMLKWRPL